MEGLATKALADFELKADKAGAFRATIATFNTVDHDGDVTFPGAFPVGKDLIVGAYNHSSMPPLNALPTGKGTIGADASRAWVDGQFFLDTPHGAAMYATVKNLGPTAEWSYTYPKPKTAPLADFKDAFPTAVRGLVVVDPFEASTVIKGAGIGTGTDYIKSLGLTFDEKATHLFEELDQFFGLKVGRTISAATRARLTAVLDELQKLLVDTAVDADPPKSHNDVELQRFLRAARDDMERVNATRLVDLRAI